MNFLTQKFNQTKKAISHYLNPNSNPTQKDQYAFSLLTKGQVQKFISFIQSTPDVNLHVVDYNKTSFLIKAQDIANDTSVQKKLLSQEQRTIRALKAVSYLLKKGVDINYRDKNGITALMSACHWGNLQVAELLLQNNADANLGSDQNYFYTTPLLSAWFKKNMELVVLLMKYEVDVQKTIQVSFMGNGFKLTQKDMQEMRALGNVVKLIRKRREGKQNGERNLLTMLPQMIFEDVCYNV